MTGTGSGYIGNRCVLNPFAGITPLYLHNLFPFIEVRSVPPPPPLYSGYPAGKQSSYNTLASPFYSLQPFPRHTPCRKPGYCFCKVRLSATSPDKDRWRLQPENLPLRLRWRAYLPLPPCPHLPPIPWAEK